jgi:tetratricopeptide (TPR) repeat protein
LIAVTENARILELRRRVQADPASIAFAQLAEECRRSGDSDQAVVVCRAGLVHHPDYLSARVTLGRALLEIGRLDEAQAELNIVLASASDNLPANRALAEVYQKKGQLPEALRQYKRALELAKFDPEIEHEVQRIESVVSPPPAPPKTESAPVSVEDLFDFDTLLAQLGGRTQPKAEAPRPAAPVMAVPSALDLLKLPADDSDPFAVLERQLRENEELLAPRRAEAPGAESLPAFLAAEPQVLAVPDPIPAAPAGPSEEELRERRVLGDLEDWLAAIVADRERHLSA